MGLFCFGVVFNNILFLSISQLSYYNFKDNIFLSSSFRVGEAFIM